LLNNIIYIHTFSVQIAAYCYCIF